MTDPARPSSNSQTDGNGDDALGLAHPAKIAGLLWRLARDPIGTMRHGPVLTWPAALSLQAGTAAVAGAVYGLVSGSVLNFALGLIAFPIVAAAASFGIAFFLRAGLQISAGARLGRRALYSLVSQATLPYLVLHGLSSYLPPIDLLGFLLACLLLTVGLIERFRLPRTAVIRLAAAAFLLFFAAWAWTQARSAQQRDLGIGFDRRRSLDELERGLKKDQPPPEAATPAPQSP